MATRKKPTTVKADPLDDLVLKAVYDNLSQAEKDFFDGLASNEAKTQYLTTIKERIDASTNASQPEQPKVEYDPNTVAQTNAMTESAIGVTGSRLISKETGNPIGGTYKGYTVQQQVEVPGFMRGGYRAKEPLYFEGDEKLITRLGREELATLQQKLVKIGKLGKKFRLGVADSTTVQAFTGLLAEANFMGVDYSTALKTLEASPQVGSGTGLSARVDNPDDLKRIIKRASQAVLGYSVPDDKVMNLVRAYQQEQIKAQTGSSVNAPSPESFAQARLEEQMPEDAKAYKFAQFAQQFLGS